MSKAINTVAAFNALNVFASTIQGANETLVISMRAAGVLTVEDAQPLVLQWVSEKEMFAKSRDENGLPVSLGKCPLVDGQRIAAGRKVLQNPHPAYESAKKTYQRAMAAFAPAEKPADKGESAPTVEKATKAEKEAHKALQAAREALRVAEAAFVAACGAKARAKAIDAALSA